MTSAETPRRGDAAHRKAPKAILSTKLTPPALPKGYVERPRLLELVTRGVEGPVTRSIRDAIVDIQRGRAEDPFGWSRRRDA